MIMTSLPRSKTTSQIRLPNTKTSQTLTHAAGALLGHPLQKRTEVRARRRRWRRRVNVSAGWYNGTKPILEPGHAARQRLLTMQRFLPFWSAMKLRSSRCHAWYQNAPKARDLLHLVEILAVAPLFFDLRRNPVGLLALSLTTTVRFPEGA
jgi:hypothetical protein